MRTNHLGCVQTHTNLCLSPALYHLPHQLFLSQEWFTTALFSPLDYCSLPYFILYATSFLEHLSLTHSICSFLLLFLSDEPCIHLPHFPCSSPSSCFQEWSDKQLDTTISQATSLAVFQRSLEALKLQKDVTSLETCQSFSPYHTA